MSELLCTILSTSPKALKVPGQIARTALAKKHVLVLCFANGTDL